MKRAPCRNQHLWALESNFCCRCGVTQEALADRLNGCSQAHRRKIARERHRRWEAYYLRHRAPDLSPLFWELFHYAQRINKLSQP